MTRERIGTFEAFHPFYLSEHTNRTSRRLHFSGTSIALALVVVAVLARTSWLAGLALVQGYAFAWIGHFFFERNRPATSEYPIFSLIGDWRMWWEILTGRIKF